MGETVTIVTAVTGNANQYQAVQGWSTEYAPYPVDHPLVTNTNLICNITQYEKSHPIRYF